MDDSESDFSNSIRKNEEIRKLARKIIHAKVGCLYLLSKEPLKINENNKPSTSPNEFRSHMRKILTTDPRVLSIVPLDMDDRTKFWDFGYRLRPADVFKRQSNGSIDKKEFAQYKLHPPLLFELKLEIDKGKQEKPFWLVYPFEDKIEKCYALWDGEIFFAWVDAPARKHLGFGYAVRDVVTDIFKASPLLSVDCIGPTPIHPDIEVQLFSANKLQEILKTYKLDIMSFVCSMDNDDLVVRVITEDDIGQENTVRNAIREIFDDCRIIDSPLIRFYDTMVLRSAAIAREEQLETKLKQLRQLLFDLNKLKSWNLINRVKVPNSLGKGISEATLMLMDREEAFNLLAQSRNELHKSNNEYLTSSLIPYFEEHAEQSPSKDVVSITTALERLDCEIGRHSAFQAQLFAALLGVAAGAGLTLLATWLGHVMSK